MESLYPDLSFRLALDRSGSVLKLTEHSHNKLRCGELKKIAENAAKEAENEPTTDDLLSALELIEPSAIAIRMKELHLSPEASPSEPGAAASDGKEERK
jgi:hypothetical protein